MLSREHNREGGMARQTFADFLARGLPFGNVVDHPFVYDALRDKDFPDAE
jgi:cytochrome c